MGRRERWLRSWLKHERQTVRMVFAETFYHSSAPFPRKFKGAPLFGAHRSSPTLRGLVCLGSGPQLRGPSPPSSPSGPFHSEALTSHPNRPPHPTFKTEIWCWPKLVKVLANGGAGQSRCWPKLVLAKLSLAKLGKTRWPKFVWPKMVRSEGPTSNRGSR